DLHAPRRDGDVAGLIAAAPRETIERLEQFAFNAWPAQQSVERDGWVLRFNDGFTRRANSANAFRPAARPLEPLIDEVAAAYRATGLRPIFRLTPLAPRGIDALLARRDYALLDPSLVQTARIDWTQGPGDPSILIEKSAGAAWLAGYVAASALDPAPAATLAAMLTRIPEPVGFARIADDGSDLAFGFAAVEDDHVGLFDIVTMAAARRRGLGLRLVRSLLAWASRHGAEHAYLQVVEANTAAQRLYARLGFATAYGYHYRVATR
ncbi:MAG: GNAT family N-acetyltransferase, partial [Alphaproteobacteria bacterium]|nr:GNAT family N-acetyltransferase [Alphaproteobacteria bacterium]